MDRTFGEKVNGVTYFDRKGAYLICIKENKVLLVKTAKGYFLLGGGIEAGEDHLQCLEREALEEIGCRIKVGDYVFSADTYCVHERIGYFHPIQYYYTGEVLEKVQEPIEEDHTLVWLTYELIEEKMYVKQQIWAVKEVMEKYPYHK